MSQPRPISLPRTDDLRIAAIDRVINPAELIAQFPVSADAVETTACARREIHEILEFHDDRMLVVVGPCSIHDPKAALEYAGKLLPLREKHRDDLLLVMRVYFEKPRTTVGWKGLINDPDLNDTFDINKGLRLARKLLLDLNGMGVPAGTEYLDIITPQYVADLIAWGAIGARTTESQVHRELSSGLSCPVGLKNGTNGNLDIAVDGIRAAARPHHFLSLTKAGQSAIYTTTGNADCHIILRGGLRPNYDVVSVNEAGEKLRAAGLPQRMMVDFSHANSRKVPENQAAVCGHVASQLARGERRIIGAMIESHLRAGRQDVVPGEPLVYGQSITDACIDFATTEKLLADLAAAVRARRSARAPAGRAR
ncbi:MAG: 3-deoxy-7-phosphoheptulonate synthase, Phe-sensitive [Arenicellales bacterium IbO2]|nr:MAG: 3-deoxy-7-phosphoheptulonate synthase, Phe-sensitive [Arenicellales bacterium IbO2]